MLSIHINNDLLSKSLAFAAPTMMMMTTMTMMATESYGSGREVKFMIGNAFLQSHCLWMVTNVNTPAWMMHTHGRTHTFISFALADLHDLLLVWSGLCWYALCNMRVPSDKPPFTYTNQHLSVYEFYLKIVMINCYLFPSIIEKCGISHWKVLHAIGMAFDSARRSGDWYKKLGCSM